MKNQEKYQNEVKITHDHVHVNNGVTYKGYLIEFGKTCYVVSVVTGIYNYINIRKATANPFGMVGKRFENFDEATRNYKNDKIKTGLLKIETGLIYVDKVNKAAA